MKLSGRKRQRKAATAAVVEDDGNDRIAVTVVVIAAGLVMTAMDPEPAVWTVFVNGPKNGVNDDDSAKKKYDKGRSSQIMMMEGNQIYQS